MKELTPEEELEIKRLFNKAIDLLVEQGRAERITMPNGKPGVRLINRSPS